MANKDVAVDDVVEVAEEKSAVISAGAMSFTQFCDRHKEDYSIYIVAYLEAEYRGVLKTEGDWAQEIKSKIKE